MKRSTIEGDYALDLLQRAINDGTIYNLIKDFADLEILFTEPSMFKVKDFLSNPFLPQYVKGDALISILNDNVTRSTLEEVVLIAEKELIEHLPDIISSFLELVRAEAKILTFKMSTADQFTKRQRRRLHKKLKKLTDANEVKLIITVDPSLIGGFLIKKDSNIIDLTAKNELKQLAKFLNVPFYF